jgi:hypothetical protein
VVLSAWIVVLLAQFTLAERMASWRRTAVATTAVLAVVIVPVWRLGGTLEARPTSEGGFEISARFPLDPNAVRPEAVR